MLLDSPRLQEYVDLFRLNLTSGINRLQSIVERVDSNDVVSSSATAERPMSQSPASDRVFVVHRRDNAAEATVTRFPERLSLKAVLLHGQATSGRP